MSFKRNKPCPCGSGKRYKKCCASLQPESIPTSPQTTPLSLIHQGHKAFGDGDLELALKYYKEALLLDPENPDANYNTGGIYKLLGQPEKAVACYEKVLPFEPNNTHIHLLLGILHTELKHKEKAELHFLKALSSGQTEAFLEYAFFLIESGRVDDAEAYYRKAISKDPGSAQVHCSLGVFHMLRNDLSEALEYFKKACMLQTDFPKAQMLAAIFAWIKRDYDSCRKYLDQTNIASMKQQEDKFVSGFSKLLDKLLDYRNAHPSEYCTENLPPFYIIGDSHALPAAHIKACFRGVEYCVESKIIVGCKAWHLSHNNENKYKYSLEKIVTSMPSGSNILFTFGEIDCRPDEGIIKHHKKTGNNLVESVNVLVKDYIQQLVQVCKAKEMNIMICNIPLRNMDTDENLMFESDRKLLRLVVETFNTALENYSGEYGVKILDICNLSKNSTGESSLEYRFDNNHLKPFIYHELIQQA